MFTRKDTPPASRPRFTAPRWVLMSAGLYDPQGGRYEVTVGEYYGVFASATGGGAGAGCIVGAGDSWRNQAGTGGTLAFRRRIVIRSPA